MHASGLKNEQGPVTFPVVLYVSKQQPCIHQRRDTDLRILDSSHASGSKTIKKCGDALLFHKVDEAHQCRFDVMVLALDRQVADGIDDNHAGFMLDYKIVHGHEVLLEALQRWPGSVDGEQPAFDMGP
jgi:hypothetical protein